MNSFTCLPDLIDETANTRPAALALICGDAHLTWGALRTRMDYWARVAAESTHGDAFGKGVALLTPNCADGVCAFLGIIKAGAYAVVLPHHATPETLSSLIEDSGAGLLIGDQESLSRLTLSALEKAALTTNNALSGEQPDDVTAFARHPSIEPRSIFNCVYSSGTTSKPKGILQSHDLRNNQIASSAMMGLGPEKVSILSTPLDSDTTIVGLVGALGASATLVLLEKFSADTFINAVDKHRVTHTFMVPVQYERILQSENFSADRLRSLEVSLCTGAPLSVATKRCLINSWQGSFIEIYGLTEGGATTLLSIKDSPEKLATVGCAFPGTDLRIIDDDGNELPAGEIGEIVGHDGNMMSGYTNVEAQAQVFWASPDQRQFIRTGDLGRIDEDGFLTICGRKKDMLISGGYNIYPADIEAVLSDHADVRECAVVGKSDPKWGETPVAVVSLNTNESADAVREWANARLGKTQRLSAIMSIDELPRNAGGKIDKNALRHKVNKEL